MSLSRQIAGKYFRFFTASKPVMAMTIISFLGIAIGVATLTTTFSVANGFGKEYRKSILNFNAHVVLMSTGEMTGEDELMSGLEKFRVSKEEQEEWVSMGPAVSVLKIVEYLWIKAEELFSGLKYDSGLPESVFYIADKLHPENVSEKLRLKGIYPKWLVEKTVHLLKLSQRGVSGISPFLIREGLLIYSGEIRGVVIKGARSGGFKAVNNMDIDFPENDGVNMAALGSYLATELGVKKGDTVRLMLPSHWGKNDSKSFEEFVVADIFESGMYDIDSQFVLMDLKTAQKIFNVPETISGIEIKLDDWRKAPLFALSLEDEFKYPFYASDWQELNKSLFEAVKLEKLMFVIIMSSLVVVAAFNIVGTVMLRILYKTPDIAIFRALGMKIDTVKNVFVWQGLFVGILGTLAGILIAFLVIWSIAEFNWIKIPAEIYLVKTLPVCISYLACVMISAFSLGVCWLTSIIASRRVLDIPLVKGLHRL